MVSVLVLAPLVFALALFVVLALAPVIRPLERFFNRVSWVLFQGELISPNRERERTLRAAGIGEPYRLYQTKTLLYAVIASLGGAVIGGYAVAGLIGFFGVERTAPLFAGIGFFPQWLRVFDARYLLFVFLGTAMLGGGAAGLLYALRWQVPAIRSDTRRRNIDASMPRMISFVYALSRGGMALPKVMKTISDNRDVFGTGAEEFGIAVRNINLFGDDLVSSMRDLSRRTPSSQFQNFSENLTSVLQSGQDLSSFLHNEYERYRDAAEEQQKEILEVLATAAEIYVTVAVAGMLFFITILLIIGLTVGGMLLPLRIVTYIILPVLNIIFIAYLSEITQPLQGSSSEKARAHTQGTLGAITDGGTVQSPAARENLSRLSVYQRISTARRFITNPVREIIQRPGLILYATVPIALVFVLVQTPNFIDPTEPLLAGLFDIEAFDDTIIRATLFVLITFTIIYEIGNRQAQNVADALPDLLDRLASLNEAGLSVVSSFERVRRSDMGALDAEVDRIWRDIQWGATVEESLERFESRVRTPSITRVTTLLTNSMRASNEIGPVLRIAAEQARSDKLLKRQRRQETIIYLLVIYIAFMVFLVVVGVIVLVLIPNLPATESIGGEGISSPISGISEAEKGAYTLVFIHAGIIQSALSGIVGGQMSEGTLRDGLKHASIMLTMSYLGFLAVQWISANGGISQFTSAFGGV